ncbi:MAG: hypothetical protein ACI9SB_000817 [Candidatus Azotimanducaceae bacterium]|jgi:hypothetical protein
MFERYKLAADNASTAGQAGLGVLYSRGLGVAVDDTGHCCLYDNKDSHTAAFISS